MEMATMTAWKSLKPEPPLRRRTDLAVRRLSLKPKREVTP